jgi:hypothetical protein
MAYTDIDKPSDYFNTAPYSGDSNTTQAITGVGFQPDWVWIKSRSSAANHNLWDIIRGTSKYLKSNSTDAEITDATLFNSFNSDGFTVGNGGIVNDSGQTYVGWCWKGANGTASNTDGSITSTVSANTTSGFSIVGYTGTLSTDTVGHGLGTTPNIIIVKNRTTAQNWSVNGNVGGLIYGTNKLLLQGTDALISDTNEVTSANTTTFSLSNSIATNESGSNLIAYCFAEKKGFSKFGSYTGNGSTNGTFVYTGFKPAFVITKRTDGTVDWYMFDNKRQNSFNVVNGMLRPSATSTELDESSVYVDFLSNGFKWRGNNAGNNTSGGSYIYMAFAENPFVTSTGIPACAR